MKNKLLICGLIFLLMGANKPQKEIIKPQIVLVQEGQKPYRIPINNFKNIYVVCLHTETQIWKKLPCHAFIQAGDEIIEFWSDSDTIVVHKNKGKGWTF